MSYLIHKLFYWLTKKQSRLQNIQISSGIKRMLLLKKHILKIGIHFAQHCTEVVKKRLHSQKL